MAAVAQSSHPPKSSFQGPSDVRGDSKDNPSLPDGICNFRVLTVGGNAPQCGCRRYWRDTINRGVQTPSNGNNSSHEDPLSCVCGHHACFHEYTNRDYDAIIRNADSGLIASTEPCGPQTEVTGTAGHLYIHLAPHLDKSHAVTDLARAEDSHRAVRQTAGTVVQDMRAAFADLGASNSGRLVLPGGRLELQDKTSPNQAIGIQANKSPSDLIASEVLLDCGPNSGVKMGKPDKRDLGRKVDQRSRQRLESTNSPKTSSHHHYQNHGLGLGLAEHPTGGSVVMKAAKKSINPGFEKAREVSGTNAQLQARVEAGLSLSTHLGHHITPKCRSSAVPSTIEMGQPYRPSPNRFLVEHVTGSRRSGAALQEQNNMPIAPHNEEDCLLSATELNTPSHAGTPDQRVSDTTVNEVRNWIELVDSEMAKGQGRSQIIQNSPQQSCAGTSALKPNIDPQESSGASSPNSAEKLRRSHSITYDNLVSSFQQVLPHLRSILSHLNAQPTVETVLRGHAHRLDLLENASYSYGCVEEVQDKVELLETHLMEIGNKVDEHEKWHAVADEISSAGGRSIARRKTNKEFNNTESFTSNRSFATNVSSHSASSTAMIAAAIDRVEMSHEIEALKSKITELEALAAPSAARPWSLEVVFLPWGQQLRGVWFPATDFPTSSSRSTTQGTEEWTQFQSLISSHRPSMAFKDTTDVGGWDGESIQRWADGTDTWVLPKACGPRSKVYRRLCSRGLVCTVQINGPSASDVQKAVILAIGSHLEALGKCGSSLTGNGQTAPPQDLLHLDSSLPLGLKAPFVPLRKAHKDSRLRYLKLEELISPVLWSADFLRSSVVMRGAGGHQRLFITTANGYLQHNDKPATDLSWQNIRQLPRVYAEGEPDQRNRLEVGEADAMEPCWEWDARLDPPISATSSFSSSAGHHSSHVPLPQQSNGSLAPSGSTTPLVIQPPAPISPLSEFPLDCRRQSQRTSSAPGFETIPSLQKRRVASPVLATGSKFMTKRRRISPSPPIFEHSVPGVVWTNTPRRSNPTSPFVAELAPSENRSQVTGTANVKRGGTPFAYATPHSGTVAIEHRGGTTISTEVDSLLHQPQVAPGEEEVWEGVEDEAMNDFDEGEDEAEHEDYDDDHEEGEVSDESDV
ncbi:MAG: hypothetical protein M1812_000104 [Candelaria pacifica]|nr:MAG: hypothetical protein M1812_000104 [Candelaria pacifica]